MILDEKKVMSDKLFAATILAIGAGFLIGVGFCLVAFALIFDRTGTGVVGGIAVVLAALCGHMGDRVRRPVVDFIKQPYIIEMEVSDEGPENQKVSGVSGESKETGK